MTDRGDGGLRPVEYSDMVILLRATSGWDEEFKAVLEEEGIPVYITSRSGYFGAAEVQELLQLLRVLDNPRQDIPLFGVMKSVSPHWHDAFRLQEGQSHNSDNQSPLSALSEAPAQAYIPYTGDGRLYEMDCYLRCSACDPQCGHGEYGAG